MQKQRGAAWGEMRTSEMGVRACQGRGRCRGSGAGAQEDG